MKLIILIQAFILFKFGLCSLNRETKTCPEPYSSCNPGKEGMLNVHIVPHTHNDVGWLKTVDQYYYGANTINQRAGVQYILDNVMQELSKDPNRRFVYVELAFFWRWWNEQDDEMKQQVRAFVDEGRLEFVIGAWCMNDEATTYYNDIIDQQTLGLQFILREFGDCARPRVAWQLDPFGHSREQASLFAQFGFDGLFLGRIDYQDNQDRSQTKNREFVWKSSSNLGPSVDLFTGVLPNTYAPPNGFCFDSNCEDDPIMDNPDLEDYNVDEKVDRFMNYVREYQNEYRSNNIIMTMGSDFQYSNARMWFKNLDKLIRYVNLKQNETNVNLFYSTPACYLHSLYKSNLTWSTKYDDFFPYANKAHAFWTGYFTSRATLKYYVRRTNNYFQAVRQLGAIAQLNTDSVAHSLSLLDDAMGVLQHHDAVSGTERQHVARDYAKRLAKGTEATRSIISQAYADILSRTQTVGELPTAVVDQQYCPLLNISECLAIENKDSFTIILYNPIARDHETWIRIPVSDSSYTVKDANTGAVIPSEVSEIYEETKKIPERFATTNYELLFKVLLPPLGIKTYNVSKAAAKSDNISPKSNDKVTGSFQLQNQNIQLSFDATGTLQGVQALETTAGVLNTNLKQTFCYYNSFIGINPLPNEQSSGAYIFRPKEQDPTCLSVQSYTLRQSNFVQEVHQIYNDWISQTIRLYDNSNSVEFEWQVGPIPIEILTGKEVVTKFTSDLQSNKTFYTDANGREMLKRVRDYRPSWSNFNQTEPVSGNYYPINSRIFIRDETSDSASRQLTVVTERSQGGASINDGSLEVMIHRRILFDDSLGVTEPLDELGLNLKGLIVKGKHYLFFNTSQDSAKLHRDFAHKLNMQPLITFPAENSQNMFKNLNAFNTLKQSLPNNVELLTLVHDFNYNQPGVNALIVRFEHFYELNEDPVYSQPATFDVIQLFNSTFTILDLEELSLGANMPVSELNNRLKWNYIGKESNTDSVNINTTPKASYEITLQPMQIRTFRVWCLPMSKL